MSIETGYSADTEYRLSPNDTIIEFVSEACILQAEYYTSTENLFSAYTAFCVKNQLRAVPSKSGFSQRLSSLYATQIVPHRYHKAKDNNNHGYFGITISSDYVQIPQEIVLQKSYDEQNEDDDYVAEFDDVDNTNAVHNEQE